MTENEKKHYQEKFQKKLNYAKKENWEGMIDWILEVAKKYDLKLKS